MDLGQERPKVTGNLTSRNLDYEDLAGFVGAPRLSMKGKPERQSRKSWLGNWKRKAG